MKSLGHGRAFHEFHDHQQLILNSQRCMKTRDIGVTESGKQLDLAQEPALQVCHFREVREQDLHGFHAVGDSVSNLVNLAHTTRAKNTGHFVIADPGSGFKAHEKSSRVRGPGALASSISRPTRDCPY